MKTQVVEENNISLEMISPKCARVTRTTSHQFDSHIFLGLHIWHESRDRYAQTFSRKIRICRQLFFSSTMFFLVNMFLDFGQTLVKHWATFRFTAS